MKHHLNRFISVSMTALMMFSLLPTTAFATDDTVGITDTDAYYEESYPVSLSDDDDTFDTVIVSGTYYQDKARELLDLVNEFRTGSDTWYWNSDNTTKTKVKNLGKVVYDYQLEKIAMQRAIEIALSFGHTRPNGESCRTVYSDYKYSYSAAGENIAAGYTSVQAVFDGWLENTEDYSGQGHRRNMLRSNITRMGCACVKYNGYYYWVQEFSASNQTITKTTANNSLTSMKVEILPSNITSVKLTAASSALSVDEYSKISLPAVSASLSLSATWPNKASCKVTPQGSWTSRNTSIATISNSTLKGVNYGSTKAVYSALGSTVSVGVTVNCVHSYTTSVIKDPTSAEADIQIHTCSKCNSSYQTTGTASVDTSNSLDVSNSLSTSAPVEKKTNKLTVKNQTTLTASTSKAQTLKLDVQSLSGKTVTYSDFKSSGSVKATYKDGKITFPKNFVGKVTITAQVAENDTYLTASKTITITVKPTSTTLSSVSNTKGKKMTVKWKKNTLCSGYRIQYSTSKDFSSSKTTTITKQSTTSTKLSNLQKGKTYYVRIQTYKTVNGTKYYSAWSSASKVKISK
jgi:uncharacterized protein YkwD